MSGPEIREPQRALRFLARLVAHAERLERENQELEAKAERLQAELAAMTERHRIALDLWLQEVAERRIDLERIQALEEMTTKGITISLVMKEPNK